VAFDSTCDACGADLPKPDDKGFVRCESCGRVTQVEVPKPEADAGDIDIQSGGFHISIKGGAQAFGSPTASTTDFTTTDFTSPIVTVPTSSGGRKLGCIFAIICVLIGPVIAIIAIIGTTHKVKSAIDSVRQKADIGTSSSNVFALGGDTVPLVDPAAKTPSHDVGALIQDYFDNDSHRYVGRLHIADGKITQVWRSDPELPNDTSSLQVALTGDTVFAGFDDHLWALDAKTGKRIWTTELSDKITTSCDQCFQIVQGKLIVRTADANLTAFSPKGGEPIWQQLLVSAQAEPQVVHGRLLVLDDAPDKHRGGAAVRTLDPATGHTMRRFQPACAKDGKDPFAPETGSFDDYDRYFAGAGLDMYEVPGTDDIVIAFASGDGCAVRWNGKTNKLVWRTFLEGASSVNQEDILVSARHMVFTTTSEALVDINLSTGKGQLITKDVDKDTQPHQIIGNLLLADIKTNRGTTRSIGMEAFNLDTGKKAWIVNVPHRAQPASRGRYRSSDTIYDDDSVRFVLAPTAEGARVLVFTGEKSGHTYSDQSLNLTNGILGPDKGGTYVSHETGSVTLYVEQIAKDHLLINVSNILQVIPLGGGKIATYP
jgi:outer membrane protein assembly factor BamB